MLKKHLNRDPNLKSLPTKCLARPSRSAPNQLWIFHEHLSPTQNTPIHGVPKLNTHFPAFAYAVHLSKEAFLRLSSYRNPAYPARSSLSYPFPCPFQMKAVPPKDPNKFCSVPPPFSIYLCLSSSFAHIQFL